MSSLTPPTGRVRIWSRVRATLLLGFLATAPIAGQSSPELFRLVLERNHRLSAPLSVASEDLTLELREGAAFVALAEERPTAVVLVGRGEFSFTPPVRSEQRQLELFTGSTAVRESFEAAYVRVHPDDFESRFAPAALHEGEPPASLWRRAEAVFQEQLRRSFAVWADSREGPLSLLPPRGDFQAELYTSRFGRLAYARIAAEAEDLVFLDRERGRRIASYPSRERLAVSGFGFGDEHGLGFEALAYEVEASFDPSRAYFDGRARISLRALETLETVSLGLDRGLTAREVKSSEHGEHQFLKPPESDSLRVRLVPPLAPGGRILLEIRYAGSVEPQELTRPVARGRKTEPAASVSRKRFLYSNRVYWYPQSPTRNHTPAILSITVPSGYLAVASGLSDPPVAAKSPPGARTFRFRTEEPVRFLPLLVDKLELVYAEPAREAVPLSLSIFSSPPMTSRAIALAPHATRILRFYSGLLREAPYPRLALVLVEAGLPAGHSPASLSVLGEPAGWNPRAAGDDPAHFAGAPELFLAHEIAHQWWGQAVGWRNYRAQWLSEGLAQYFASLYIRETSGEEAFQRVLKWIHRWALDAEGKGPISLGVRVGEVTGCATCLAAVLYDRGASVLHMLREWIGDEKFFEGLRIYYARWKFRRASTQDLRHTMEESSGMDLSRFFERWIEDDGIPQLDWSAETVSQGGRRKLRLRVRQGTEAFELPLSVSIEYKDRAASRERIRVRLPEQEFLFDLEGSYRRLRLNEDEGALCRLREIRQKERREKVGAPAAIRTRDL